MLLLASQLQAFYGILSERLLLVQPYFNLLYLATCTKNRERLLNEQVMGR